MNAEEGSRGLFGPGIGGAVPYILFILLVWKHTLRWDRLIAFTVTRVDVGCCTYELA